MDEYTALAEAREKPRDYFGPIPDLIDQGWAVVWGQHRDSDNLDKSNWDYVLKFLNENYKVNEDFTVEGSSHWAVGWMDQLLVRALKCNCPVYDEQGLTNDPNPDFVQHAGNLYECITCGWSGTAIQPVFYDVYSMAQRVQDYPLLDEEDYSRREHEDFLDWIEQEFSWACGQADLSEEQMEQIEYGAIAEHLYDNYSVSSVEDIGDASWIVETVKYLAGRKQDVRS